MSLKSQQSDSCIYAAVKKIPAPYINSSVNFFLWHIFLLLHFAIILFRMDSNDGH